MYRWTKAPKEPNCVSLTDQQVASMSIGSLMLPSYKKSLLTSDDVRDYDEETSGLCASLALSHHGNHSDSKSNSEFSQLLPSVFDYAESEARRNSKKWIDYAAAASGLLRTTAVSLSSVGEGDESYRNYYFGNSPVQTLFQPMILPSPQDTNQYEVRVAFFLLI
jgi:hypothetical protein